jgi:hypothetical protein
MKRRSDAPAFFIGQSAILLELLFNFGGKRNSEFVQWMNSERGIAPCLRALRMLYADSPNIDEAQRLLVNEYTNHSA